MDEKIYVGGLMRCCTATLSEVRAAATDTPKDGDVIDCKWCSSSMIWRDGWRWNNEEALKR